jgi:hypothetical protein
VKVTNEDNFFIGLNFRVFDDERGTFDSSIADKSPYNDCYDDKDDYCS